MMDDEKLTLDIEDIEEQIKTQSNNLSHWKDEQRAECERLLAIQRNIVNAERMMDTLTIKKKALEEKQIKTERITSEKPYE